MSDYALEKLRRTEPTKWFQSFLLLPVDVDISCAGVVAAIEILKKEGIEADVLLCSRPDHFPAKEILNGKYGEVPAIEFWSRHDFQTGTWCLGTFKEPMMFVGSVGA